MKFERVRLENFKCYADADLRLKAGVTVIHGLNGSGKSSLLEACFFALYGARALEQNLDEIVTIGADEATVELWFTHGGEPYHLERRVRATGERASTATCVLETPDGTFEGARDVREHVAQLLRMDHESFVNCAYVRQGEVNKLINASPSERQDMIDDLLQLGKLEDYRERASSARLGVKHVRDAKAELLDEVAAQIERKEEKDLHDRLNGLQTRLSEVEGEIENYESQRENAVTTRDEAESIIETHEEKRDELRDLAGDIEDLTTQIAETERERDNLQAQIRELKGEIEDVEQRRSDLLADTALDPSTVEGRETVENRLETLEERKSDLRDDIEEHRLAAQEHASEAESLRETADELESRADEKRERADELEADIAETKEKLADRREKIETLEDKIEAEREVFADAPIDVGEAEAHRESVADDLTAVREQVTELETTVENEREALAEAEELLDAGKCPECGQSVEDSPHVESIEDDRERIEQLESDLADLRERREELQRKLERADELVETESRIRDLETNRENIQQLVDEQAENFADREAEVADLRETATELEAEAEETRESATESEAAAQEQREAIAECNREQQSVRESIEQLESVLETFEAVNDLTGDIERLREQRSNKQELNDERRDRLADKREQKAALEDEFDESAVEKAENEYERAVEYIEQVDGKLDELRAERDELGEQIGGVKQELAELADLRDRRDDLVATVDRLESLYNEAEQLQEMYGTLRSELRQRNVESLERMLNETFDLVYQNDSYSRIELDGEYELTVYQKDGEPLDPEQLSGGERALFNLSLRCAIYRLLAEGIEGSAPMPPLILDEPTVFLDSGHVSQLVELVNAMRDMGVEQIVVVSHDDELVGAADDLVTVRKDSTTNRSSVERGPSEEVVLEEAGLSD